MVTPADRREAGREGAARGLSRDPRGHVGSPTSGDPLLERVARRLPRPIIAALMQAAARAAGRGSLGRRARANLELVLGDELGERARREVERGSLRHAARVATEWAQLSRLKLGGQHKERALDWLEEQVSLDDSVRHLDEELEAGRGVILATAHIGNWELLGARVTPRILARGRTPIAVGLDRSGWLRRLRAAYGVEGLPQNTHPRVLKEALTEGRPVALLADMEVRRLAGAFLPFLGVPALTMTAPAALARASGCAILPMRCYIPNGSDSYRVSFEAPLSLDASLPKKEGTIDLTSRLNQVYEAWIRETPAQWAWYQPRWRTRPGTLEAIPLAARAERPDLPGAYDGDG